MDHDKDGILGVEDLKFIFDQVGRIITDAEIEEMLEDAPGPINFTQLLQLFASRMQGGGKQQSILRNFKLYLKLIITRSFILLSHCYYNFLKYYVDNFLRNLNFNFKRILKVNVFFSFYSGADDDETIMKAFQTFDNGQGKIDGDR